MNVRQEVEGSAYYQKHLRGSTVMVRSKEAQGQHYLRMRLRREKQNMHNEATRKALLIKPLVTEHDLRNDHVSEKAVVRGVPTEISSKQTESKKSMDSGDQFDNISYENSPTETNMNASQSSSTVKEAKSRENKLEHEKTPSSGQVIMKSRRPNPSSKQIFRRHKNLRMAVY
eukprot:CAMPEP_0113950804 /NCGR_PEP_ID=MMETSP1339-20121228/82604_1 /TAXON_ID=94617 /ORGANISM="Fibrocapsa japonica" /LENGTH=171 /DNA_ID=CAMNT_0000958775 /DNA_START=131 /DNA_END=649 /DNA_ORIENTATION=- /assembly_acc=CAM_ASM_000762